MEYLKNMLIGAVIGVANIIPGVSGGTMMVILKVFDKLVNAVSSLKKEFRASVKFLSAILLGAGIALLLLSGGINWLLDNHYMATNLFFVGVIAGSLPMVWDRASGGKKGAAGWAACAAALAAMLAMTYLVPSTPDTVVTDLTPFVFFKLFVCSAVAAFCMIIPGLSGSFMMVLFGTYHTVTAAISGLNIPILLPAGLGIAAGILLGAKLISKLLARFPYVTYFAILGFMLGSFPAIFEKIRAANAFAGGWELAAGVFACILGAAVAFVFSNERIKAKLEGKKV